MRIYQRITPNFGVGYGCLGSAVLALAAMALFAVAAWAVGILVAILVVIVGLWIVPKALYDEFNAGKDTRTPGIVAAGIWLALALAPVVWLIAS